MVVVWDMVAISFRHNANDLRNAADHSRQTHPAAALREWVADRSLRPRTAASDLLHVRYRCLLDAISVCPPRGWSPNIEVATVTHLLRPARWGKRTGLTSVVTSCYGDIAVSAAERIDQAFPGVHFAIDSPSHASPDREQFEVLVATSSVPDVSEWLAGLWNAAIDEVGSSGCPSRRAAAARTIWRAALLVSSSSRRRGQIKVSVPDVVAVAVLERAAEALGAAVRGRRRPDRSYVATVDDATDAVSLLRTVGAGAYAEAWAGTGEAQRR
jgi:hypothetical protein